MPDAGAVGLPATRGAVGRGLWEIERRVSIRRRGTHPVAPPHFNTPPDGRLQRRRGSRRRSQRLRRTSPTRAPCAPYDPPTPWPPVRGRAAGKTMPRCAMRAVPLTRNSQRATPRVWAWRACRANAVARARSCRSRASRAGCVRRAAHSGRGVAGDRLRHRLRGHAQRLPSSPSAAARRGP